MRHVGVHRFPVPRLLACALLLGQQFYARAAAGESGLARRCCAREFVTSYKYL